MGDTGAGPAPRVAWDAVSVLSLYLFALYLIQARWVVGPLGAVGTPAILLGLVAALWRIAGAMEPRLGFAGGWQPVRLVVLLHAWYVALGFAIARMRPLTDLEASGSTRNLITVAALTGLALLAADGIGTRERLDTLLRRLVAVATAMAVIGLVQFVTGFNPVTSVQWPLLTLTTDQIAPLNVRSVFTRPLGTALHEIEFGVVLAAVLPLALHYFLVADSRRRQVALACCVALMGTAIAASLSRAAVAGVVVGVGFLSLVWSWRLRLTALVVGTGAVAALWVTIPGLVGTIRDLVLRAGHDPSVQARLERVPQVLELIGAAPWLGRGSGTLSVDDYLLVDNQYYETLIESGVVGLAVVLLTMGVGVAVARRVRHRGADAATRHLGQALAASILVCMVAAATYTAFFYRIFTGTLFLLLGCAGALWRLEVRPRWAEAWGIRREADPGVPVATEQDAT